MYTIEEHKTKFKEKVLELQALKGKNSRMLTRDHYNDTIVRPKELERADQNYQQYEKTTESEISK